MPVTIGIRREDKNRWERRVPLVPEDVQRLVARGIHTIVQPSPIRVFPEQDYARAGALIQEDISSASTIFAVKEIPIELLLPDKTYVFFSHVIKGQEHNMPMLRRLMDLRCTLIEYERIVDSSGKRLIFFGTHAGHAGMIDTFHLLGRRLDAEGTANPFSEVRMAHGYGTLQEAIASVRRLGEKIASDGLPPEISPLVIGITGYGHVSVGAQDILEPLPIEEIYPRDLLAPGTRARLSGRKVYKTVFREEDMAESASPSRAFDRQDYYDNPDRYRGIFHRYLPLIDVLVNCIYWDHRYPRVVRRQDLRALFASDARPTLRVIGDISCDIDGGIECTVKSTDPSAPSFVYLPREDRVVDGLEGWGPVVMAIDNLPCELPREASEFFSRALIPYTEAIARADMSGPLDTSGLPEEIRRATIVHRGALTPGYKHLEEHLRGKEISR